MRTHKRLLMIAGLVATACLVSGCLPYSTGNNEVGVRTIKWSPFGGAGVQEKYYPPGQTQFFVPFITDWNTFDKNIQNIEMFRAANKGDRAGRDELLFKSIDGNDIGMDVIITYQIDPEKAPYILQRVARNDEELREVIVRTIARSKPRDIFGELNTEEFYDAVIRSRKAEDARDRLNEIMQDYGVTIQRVGMGDYSFNPEYEEAIAKKKVADQEAERLKSETEAKREEFLTEVEKARAKVASVRATADGEYTRALIEADAEYEKMKQQANAILAEGQAEAEGIMAMNEALAGAGGEAMVKLAIAEALANKRIIMLPTGGGGLDVRSTDINSLLQLYGIQSLGTKAAN